MCICSRLNDTAVEHGRRWVYLLCWWELIRADKACCSFTDLRLSWRFLAAIGVAEISFHCWSQSFQFISCAIKWAFIQLNNCAVSAFSCEWAMREGVFTFCRQLDLWFFSQSAVIKARNTAKHVPLWHYRLLVKKASAPGSCRINTSCYVTLWDLLSCRDLDVPGSEVCLMQQQS